MKQIDPARDLHNYAVLEHVGPDTTDERIAVLAARYYIRGIDTASYLRGWRDRQRWDEEVRGEVERLRSEDARR